MTVTAPSLQCVPAIINQCTMHYAYIFEKKHDYAHPEFRPLVQLLEELREQVAVIVQGTHR